MDEKKERKKIKTKIKMSKKGNLSNDSNIYYTRQTNDFARIHVLMIIFLLAFFGILIIPYCLQKIRTFRFKYIEGEIINIVYSDTNPSMTIADVQYSLKGETYVIRETFYQQLNKKDHIILYINPHTYDVIYKKPKIVIYILLFVVYFILLLMCLYHIWILYVYKK